MASIDAMNVEISSLATTTGKAIIKRGLPDRSLTRVLTLKKGFMKSMDSIVLGGCPSFLHTCTCPKIILCLCRIKSDSLVGTSIFTLAVLENLTRYP